METLQQRIARAIHEEVEIRPYDTRWVRLFENEKAHLLACLPAELIRRIEHFGSTAVPGLAAKPIVDMLVEVTDLEQTKVQIAPILEAQGYDYFWRPTSGDDGPPFYERVRAPQDSARCRVSAGSGSVHSREDRIHRTRDASDGTRRADYRINTVTTQEQSHDDLALARDHLAKAESTLVTEDGLHHLQEGLAHLEAVIDGKPGAQRESVARNLGQTYTSRIYEYIGREIDKNRSLTEPELEHLFAVIRAFDDVSFELPPHSGRLKVDIVRRLIDLYYEGYTATEKEEVFKKLAEVSGDHKT